MTHEQQRIYKRFIARSLSALTAGGLLLIGQVQHGAGNNLPTQNRLEEKSVSESTGARDFDFLIGKWNVHNRKLNGNGARSKSWLEFEATLEVRMILDGFGNVDEYKVRTASLNFEGTTLRIFQPQTQQWNLYWVDSRTHVLQPPLVGRFTNGKGEFFAKDTFNGKSILARFIWSNITAKSAHWDQAFSEDGGATWETNWIMEFTRMN